MTGECHGMTTQTPFIAEKNVGKSSQKGRRAEAQGAV